MILRSNIRIYIMFTGTMASSIAQPLASPLSSERSPNRLSYSFPPSSPSESQPSSQVFTSLDGKSSGSTVSPHRHPPMSEKSHCPNISPKRGRNRRPVVPKLRVLTQRHPSWRILEKSRIGLPFTDHHCLNPSPPPTNVPFTSPRHSFSHFSPTPSSTFDA